MISQSKYYTQDLTPEIFKISFGDASELLTSLGYNKFDFNTPLESLVSTLGREFPFKVETNFWGGAGTDHVTTGDNSGAVPDDVMYRNIYTWGGGDIYFSRMSSFFEFYYRIFATCQSLGGQLSFVEYLGKVGDGGISGATHNIITYNGAPNTQNVIDTIDTANSNLHDNYGSELSLRMTRSGASVGTLNSIEIFKKPIADNNFDNGILNGLHFYSSGGSYYQIQCKEYFPANYSKRRSVPLHIVLAGQGEMFSSGSGAEIVLTQGLAKSISDGATNEALVIFPYHSETFAGVYNPRWQPEQIKGIIDSAIRNYRIDERRIYISGYSSGGNGVLRCLVSDLTKNYFASALVMCPFVSNFYGGGFSGWDNDFDYDLVTMADSFVDIPIKFLHNTGDSQVNQSHSSIMAAEIIGWYPERASRIIEEYPNVSSHDCWTAGYNDPLNFKFLQTHTK